MCVTGLCAGIGNRDKLQVSQITLDLGYDRRFSHLTCFLRKDLFDLFLHAVEHWVKFFACIHNVFGSTAHVGGVHPSTDSNDTLGFDVVFGISFGVLDIVGLSGLEPSIVSKPRS